MSAEVDQSWTPRPDIAARLMIQQGQAILEMYHDGKITAEEAGEMFDGVHDQDRIAPEVGQVIARDGILPLMGPVPY